MNALFGWFDILVAVVLVIGVFTGRRRGMSSELLSLMMWAAIVVVGGFVHAPFGRVLARATGLSNTVCFVGAYLILAGGIWMVVAFIRQQMGEKIMSGDTFGGYEYYLGMVAGLLRGACIVVFALALLHAPRVNKAELEKTIKSQREQLGSVYFPPFGQIQRDIMERSLSGRGATQGIPFLLIDVTPGGPSNREGIGRRREREVNDIIGR